MYFTKVLTVAALAILPAMAAPGAVTEGATDSLEIRGGGHGGPKSCKQGMFWAGYDSRCQCPKGCDFDYDMNRCGYPKWPKPRCGYREEVYCIRDRDNHCPWDDKNEMCRKDGRSKIVCCRPEDFRRRLRNEFCPKDPPKGCPGGQYGRPDGSCGCPSGQNYRNGKCCYEPFPQPQCKKGEKAFCTSDKNKVVDYDRNHDYCQDDGKNKCGCDRNPRDWCNKNWRDD